MIVRFPTELMPQPTSQNPAQAAMEGARRAMELRVMKQQTELLRQQTEQLRQQNEARLAAASVPAGAATLMQNTLTSGLSNCLAWNRVFSKDVRLVYVIASEEAYANALLAAGLQGAEADAKQALHFGPLPGTNGKVVEEMDGLCDIPDNFKIPVSFAFDIVAMKLRGASPDDIADRTRALRTIAASH